MNEYYNDEVPMYLRRAFSDDESENEETQVASDTASDKEVSDATDEAISDVVEDANNQVSEQKVQSRFSDLFSEALATRLYSEVLESDESDMEIDVDGIAEETADRVMNHIAEEAADEIYPEVREAVAEKISQKVQSYYDPYFGQMMYADTSDEDGDGADFNDGHGLDDGENAYDDDFEYAEDNETPLSHLEDMAPEMVTQSYDPDFYYGNGYYSDDADYYYDDAQQADWIGLGSKGLQKIDRAKRKLNVGVHNTRKGLRAVGSSIKNAIVSTRDLKKTSNKLYDKQLSRFKGTKNYEFDVNKSVNMQKGAERLARARIKDAWRGIGTAIKQNKRALGTAAGAAALAAGAAYGAKKLHDRYKKRRNHNAYDEFYYDNGMYSDYDDYYLDNGYYSDDDMYFDNGYYSDDADYYYDDAQQADWIGGASKALNWGTEIGNRVKGKVNKVGDALKEVGGSAKEALKKTRDVGKRSNQLYDKQLSRFKGTKDYEFDVNKSLNMKNGAMGTARNEVKRAWKGVGEAIKKNGKTLGKAAGVAAVAGAAAYGGKKLYDHYKSKKKQSYFDDFYYDNGMYSDYDPEYEQHLYSDYDELGYYGQNQFADYDYSPSLESQVADIIDTGSSRLFCDQSSLEDDVTSLL